MPKRRISFRQRELKKIEEQWSFKDLAERLKMGSLFFDQPLKSNKMALKVIDNLIVYLEFSREQILKGG